MIESHVSCLKFLNSSKAVDSFAFHPTDSSHHLPPHWPTLFLSTFSSLPNLISKHKDNKIILLLLLLLLGLPSTNSLPSSIYFYLLHKYTKFPLQFPLSSVRKRRGKWVIFTYHLRETKPNQKIGKLKVPLLNTISPQSLMGYNFNLTDFEN